MFRKLSYLFFVLLCFAHSSVFGWQQDAQEYQTHEIEVGDSFVSLKRKYGVSKDMLIQLNPDLKDGIQKGMVILIPILSEKDKVKEEKTVTLTLVEESDIDSTSTESLTSQVVYDTIRHTAVAKETLYSLSIRYNMRISEVYDINPHVREGLKIGDKVIFLKPNLEKTAELNPSLVSSTNKDIIFHPIKKGDNLYNLSHTYGVKQRSIAKFNPVAIRYFRIGDTLEIPIAEEHLLTPKIIAQNRESKSGHSDEMDSLFKQEDSSGKFKDFIKPTKFHIVKKGENLPGIAKLLGVPLFELIEQNLFIKELGLNEGDKLAYSSYDLKGILGQLNQIKYLKDDSLERLKWNRLELVAKREITAEKLLKGLKIALLFPYYTELNDSLLAPVYSTSPEEVKQAKVHRLTKPSLHFMYGAQQAIKEFKDHPVSISVDYFDTRNDTIFLQDLIFSKKLYTYDLIIGPLITRNADFFARKMGELNPNIPIVTPFSTNTQSHSNLIRSSVSNETYESFLVKYLARFVDSENIALFSLERDQLRSSEVRDELMDLLPAAYNEKYFIKNFIDKDRSQLYKFVVKDFLANRRLNYVSILGKSSSILSHNIINSISYNSDSISSVFLAHFKNASHFEEKIDEIDFLPRNASRIFVSNYLQLNDPEVRRILYDYHLTHGIYADYFSVMGFDLLYDLINVYYREGDFYENLTKDVRYGISNMFDYRYNEDGTTENKGMFLLKYNGLSPEPSDIQSFLYPKINPMDTISEEVPEEGLDPVAEDEEKEEDEEDEEDEEEEEKKSKKKKSKGFFDIF